MINPLWPEKDHRPVACKWYLDGVLPLDKALEKIVRPVQDQKKILPGNAGKTCASCGQMFQPTNNSQRYCPSCGKSKRKQRRAQAERTRRQSQKAE